MLQHGVHPDKKEGHNLTMALPRLPSSMLHRTPIKLPNLLPSQLSKTPTERQIQLHKHLITHHPHLLSQLHLTLMELQ